jgi:hypothetical protein
MKTHGLSAHKIYRSWDGMIQRTTNKNHTHYKRYGGRGIIVCKRWRLFENFRDDMLPTWESGLELDRTDNNGDYEPSNCRWVTKSVNQKNKNNKAEKQSKYEGVSWDKSSNSWRVRKGGFETEEEAYTAYLRIINANS